MIQIWLFKGSWEHTKHFKGQSALPIQDPCSSQSVFKALHGKKEKKSLFKASACFTKLEYVTIKYPHHGLRILTPFPFRACKTSMHAQNKLALEDRLTYVQFLFTWNHSPCQFSKFSFEYVLLPPRSASRAISPRLASKDSKQTAAPPYSLSKHPFQSGKVSVTRFSAIHFQG